MNIDDNTLASNELESIDRVIVQTRWQRFNNWLYYFFHPSHKYGIDRDIHPHDGKFYVFCEKCVDIFKVKKLVPCTKLVVGCEKFKVCPKCKKHLRKPPFTAKTQDELRKILQDEINADEGI